ncbi:serine/threonine-protein kinase [Nocardioides cynanchi]|uniref:serine/threonine-protein kinase n=1 Tax=Nocardioides cynanchi TaxID=2558918 RepID=UPI001246F7D9|nr:serine/threonine-protein kinase [Nocardioides cynanchi]
MSVQPSRARTVGDYELLSLLGEGGMGVVHLARRPGGPRVALKILRPHIVGDHEARARLAREVGSLERIRSRWIAEIVDADPWAPTPYVATRYVPGLSLHDHVPEEGPIRGDDLRWFARCLAEGVASVHAAGVLHRDVKPSNVLMEGRTPILIDFGLARVADDPKLTHTGWLLGTPGYLAPEILYGDDATTASDVHSWAATVAFAGTGHPPFGRGPAMAIMDRVRRGQHDLAGLPDDVRSLVAAALDPDPARRPTLDDLRARLAAPAPTHGGGDPTTPIPVSAPVAEDPFTLPLAIAAHDRADAPTWHSGAPSAPAAPQPFATPTRHLTVPGFPVSPGLEDPDDLPLDLASAPVRESPLLLLRRGVLLVVSALGAAAAVAAWPYLATAVLLLMAWLLRTCTMVVTAAGDRRRLRGARWYDVLLGPLSAPWYLVLAVPGATLLALWAVGISVAGVLVCYAVGVDVTTTLAVAGLCLALSLWVGPGSAHLRWPVRVVAQSASRRTLRWAVTTVLLLGLAGMVGHQAGVHVGWSPFGPPPGVKAGS